MEKKIKQCLTLALKSSFRLKVLHLSKLFWLDKELSQKIFDETDGDENQNEEHYNKVIKKYLADSKL